MIFPQEDETVQHFLMDCPIKPEKSNKRQNKSTGVEFYA